jgi:hypothetical protein
MKETLKPIGRFTLELYDENGNLKDKRFRVFNKLSQEGRDWLCSHIGGGTGASQMAFIAIGFGATAAASTDSSLWDEQQRHDATYAHTNTTASFSLTRTFVAGEATGDVEEAGVFNKEAAGPSAAPSGTILCRQAFSAIGKGASDTLKVTWTIDLGAIS